MAELGQKTLQNVEEVAQSLAGLFAFQPQLINPAVDGGLVIGWQSIPGPPAHVGDQTRARPDDLVQQAVHEALVGAEAQGAGDGALQMMGLIGDQVDIFGQYAVF